MATTSVKLRKMIIPVTKKAVKPAKKKLRKLLDNHKITLKNLADDERCPIKYQTVKEALGIDHPYWNQDVANLALEMIEEKKLALTNSK